jgi:hypothetical protein
MYDFWSTRPSYLDPVTETIYRSIR